MPVHLSGLLPERMTALKRKGLFVHWCQEKKDILFGLLGIVFFSIFIINSLNLRFGIATTTVIGADFFPKLFCGIGLLLSIMLVISNAVKLKKVSQKNGDTSTTNDGDELKSKEESENENDATHGYLRVFFCIIFMIALILMIKYLGFVIGSVVYCFAQIMYLSTPKQRKDRRFIIKILVISILVPIALFVAFRLGLNIMLPMGMFK